MLKVLIVDDEILIRVGIKSCIDWEANGFEVAGLADDGVHALDLVGRLAPDIVLTDIKMPNMDGLELIERIKEKHQEIRVIVLSCYNELEYVKRAMKLGADDYMLKLSMQPEALLDVLNKMKASIDEEKRREAQSSDYKDEIRINVKVIEEDLYKKLIYKAIPVEQLIRGLRKIGSTAAYDRVLVIRASIDDYLNASVQSKINDRYLLKFSIINILEEILKGAGNGDIIEMDKGEYLIVTDFDRDDIDMKSIAEEFCLKADNALKNYLNINVSFGISEFSGNMDNFDTMLSQAEKALGQKFYHGGQSILFYNNELEFSENTVFLNFYDEKLLISSLENLDADSAKDITRKFFNEISSQKKYHPSKVRMAAVEIFHSFIKVAKKFEVEVPLLREENGENPVGTLMKAETVSDLNEWFEKLIDVFVDCLSNNKLIIERPEILKLKQYICERVYEEITLEKASKITNMSKSYLSSIFKKETGEAFTDYVNRLKMEEARELIRKYGLKTYEAAERLGFSDESYFSKLFKKYIGISPSKVNRIGRE